MTEIQCSADTRKEDKDEIMLQVKRSQADEEWCSVNTTPGDCNVIAELLQDSGETTIMCLYHVINTAWMQKQVPEDQKKDIYFFNT